MSADVWCTKHNCFAVACCESRNIEERAVPAVLGEVAVGATLPPVFGTAVGGCER